MNGVMWRGPVRAGANAAVGSTLRAKCLACAPSGLRNDLGVSHLGLKPQASPHIA